MKILHITDNYCNSGGAEKYMLETCLALEEKGHKIVIMSSSYHRNNRYLNLPHRKIYFLPPSWGLRSGLKMKNNIKGIIKHEDPDVIHLHNIRYFLSPLIIQMLYKLKPTVKFCHDTRLFCINNGKKILPTDQMCKLPMGINCFIKRCCSLVNEGGVNIDLKNNLIKIWEMRTTRNLDKIIAGSKYIYNELVRNGFSKKRVFTIPLYTEKNILPFAYDRYTKGNIILWVGRFNHPLAIIQKGFIQLIQALKLMEEKDWRTVLVGNGKYIKDIKEKVRHFELEEKIDFVGSLSHEEIDNYYQKSTLVVMTPMNPESFGTIGIEAMAFGKPVVAFDVGGIREWLINGETGFLVERGNIKELAKRITQLLADSALAVRMGKRGQQIVNERFRRENHINALIKVYQEVIERR